MHRVFTLLVVCACLAAALAGDAAVAAGRRWSGPRAAASVGTPRRQAPYAPGSSPYVTGLQERPKYFVPPTNPRTPTWKMYGLPPGVEPGDWPRYAPFGFGGYRFPAVARRPIADRSPRDDRHARRAGREGIVADLIEVTEAGLYCPRGDFHVDPWRRVPRAVITHAHADHARWGCDRYLCAAPGKTVLRTRLGAGATIDALRYGESLSINGVRVSLHPAGHVLGSAQVRIEHGGVTWVVSGDYKLQPDPTCASFEPVACDVFVTESTFGLPVYRWPEPATVAAEIDAWWRSNRDAGRTSVILAYALGKAQRVAALVDPTIGPIVGHGAVMKLVEAYRASGVRLPAIDRVPPRARRVGDGRALVIAPPSVLGGSWLRLFGETSVAVASGWMLLRGIRRRRGADRGFVVSDHADFPGLVAAVEASRARRVLVTHGFTDAFARVLRDRGLDATVLPTRFVGEAAPDDARSDDD